MQKPNNYDNVQAAGDFIPLDLGGHICIVKQIEEKKSSTGKDMIVISLDTDVSDKQPKYYENQFRNDIRPNKKWGCVVYQLVLDNEGNTNKGLKTFITSVEKSNPGFKVVWGDGFTACFKNKLVGAIFGREEYLNASNEKKMATKCFFFRSVDAIKSGVPIPEDRLLNTSFTSSNQPTGSDGFMNIPDGIDEELPFN